MSKPSTGPTRVGELLPSWTRSRTDEGLVVLHVELEVREPERVLTWLRGFDPRTHYVVPCAVELSVPLKMSELVAALDGGRRRWVDLALAVRRGRSPRPEAG